MINTEDSLEIPSCYVQALRELYDPGTTVAKFVTQDPPNQSAALVHPPATDCFSLQSPNCAPTTSDIIPPRRLLQGILPKAQQNVALSIVDPASPGYIWVDQSTALRYSIHM